MLEFLERIRKFTAKNLLNLPFLKPLSKLFNACLGKASPLPPNVLADEKLTRYIVDSGHIKGRGRISHSAFMPNKKLKTSIYRISHPNIGDEEIWQIGEQYVATARKKTLKGRGDLAASIVFAEELSFDPDGCPHFRHANIVGWPDDKSAQVSKALKLSLASTLRVK